MATVSTISTTVQLPQQPRLPSGPPEYSQEYTNHLSNVLRLYFNQIDNSLQSLTNTVTNMATGSVTDPSYVITNNESSYALNSNLQISRGLVTGASVVNVYGYQGSVGNTFVPLWENAATYTYPGSALTMTYASTSSETITMLVSGLDASYNLITDTVTFAGSTTGTGTGKQFFRINQMILTAGTNVGTVTAKNSTVTYAQIAAGYGKTQNSWYTVPNGYTFYLTRVNAYSNESGGSNNFCNYRVFTQSSTGATQILLQSPFTGSYQTLRVAPRAYAAKTDIQWQFNAASSTAAVGCGVEGILIATGTP